PANPPLDDPSPRRQRRLHPLPIRPGVDQHDLRRRRVRGMWRSPGGSTRKCPAAPTARLGARKGNAGMLVTAATWIFFVALLRAPVSPFWMPNEAPRPAAPGLHAAGATGGSSRPTAQRYRGEKRAHPAPRRRRTSGPRFRSTVRFGFEIRDLVT